MPAPSIQQSLNHMIEQLPLDEELSERSIVELTVQYLLDTPEGEYKHRLNGLRLLQKIRKDRTESSWEAGLMEALASRTDRKKTDDENE